MPKYKNESPEKTSPDEKRQILTLTVTRDCNLRCRYCYEEHQKNTNQSMSIQTAKAMITKYMEAKNGFNSLEIQFFGGEPMLKFSMIKEIVTWFKTCYWEKRFIFFITTNGTILTDEMKTWFIDNKKWFKVGLSLDGTRTAHNLSRDNSYDQVKPNIDFFKTHYSEQPAKMTICRETVPYVAESIMELEQIGINFTANVVFEDIWGKDDSERSELLHIYENQLDQLVDYYTHNPSLEPVTPILSQNILYYDKPLRKKDRNGNDCTRFCGAGHEMVMVDTDGTTYPCHRFAPWVAKRELPKRYVNRQKNWKNDNCNSCKLISLCPTCAGFNWEVNGDTAMRTTFHCDAYKLEFLASTKLYANRLVDKFEKSQLKNYPKEELAQNKIHLNKILTILDKGV